MRNKLQVYIRARVVATILVIFVVRSLIFYGNGFFLRTAWTSCTVIHIHSEWKSAPQVKNTEETASKCPIPPRTYAAFSSQVVVYIWCCHLVLITSTCALEKNKSEREWFDIWFMFVLPVAVWLKSSIFPLPKWIVRRPRSHCIRKSQKRWSFLLFLLPEIQKFSFKY